MWLGAVARIAAAPSRLKRCRPGVWKSELTRARRNPNCGESHHRDRRVVRLRLTHGQAPVGSFQLDVGCEPGAGMWGFSLRSADSG